MERPPLADRLKPRDDEHLLNKNTRRGLKYYRALWWASPPWLDKSMRRQIADLYRERDRRNKALGLTDSTDPDYWVVDHIVPLSNLIVCGLHTPHNLQLMTNAENSKKSNNYWPHCPFYQYDLFIQSPEGLTAHRDAQQVALPLL